MLFPPSGLRVAAMLCAVVALVTAIGVIGVEAQMMKQPSRSWVPLLSNPLVVIAVFAAAILIWQRRKAGGYLLLAAGLAPNILNLAYGQPLRMPGLLMVLAIISVVMNWTYLDRRSETLAP
jgi:hypothetical protein